MTATTSPATNCAPDSPPRDGFCRPVRVAGHQSGSTTARTTARRHRGRDRRVHVDRTHREPPPRRRSPPTRARRAPFSAARRVPGDLRDRRGTTRRHRAPSRPPVPRLPIALNIDRRECSRRPRRNARHAGSPAGLTVPRCRDHRAPGSGRSAFVDRVGLIAASRKGSFGERCRLDIVDAASTPPCGRRFARCRLAVRIGRGSASGPSVPREASPAVPCMCGGGSTGCDDSDVAQAVIPDRPRNPRASSISPMWRRPCW